MSTFRYAHDARVFVHDLLLQMLTSTYLSAPLLSSPSTDGARAINSKVEASKALPGGGRRATTAAAATAAAAVVSGREAGGAHALLAALVASERYLAGLVDGTGRLWAACEAVSSLPCRYFCVGVRNVARVVEKEVGLAAERTAATSAERYRFSLCFSLSPEWNRLFGRGAAIPHNARL